VSVYAVNARPVESSIPASTTTESIDVRQGLNEGQQNGNVYSSRHPTGVVYSDPISTGSYAAGSDSGPFGNTMANELNFPGADAHRAIASMFNMNIPTSGRFVGNPNQKQMSGFAPTTYQATGGVSASASAVSISSQ
jgi:hypothetical protein